MAKLVVDVHPDRQTIVVDEAVQTFRFVCRRCDKPINSAEDHVVWLPAEEGHTPTEFDFLHRACDAGPNEFKWLTISRFFLGFPVLDDIIAK